MEAQQDENLQKAVAILKKASRTEHELDFIQEFLLGFEALRKQFWKLPVLTLRNLWIDFYLCIFERGQVLFHQGDFADKYYFIIDGVINVSNVLDNGSLDLVDVMRTGTSVGERGLIRQKPRALTAYAKVRSYAICLDKYKFDKLLGNSMTIIQEQKHQLLEEHVPFIKDLTYEHRQKIWYAMTQRTYSKGTELAKKGSRTKKLHFVADGEWDIIAGPAHIVRLIRGSYFGEESVLHGQPYKYNIVVTSEFIKIFSISKSSVIQLLPEQTLENIKKNYSLKNTSRTLLTRMRSSDDNVDQLMTMPDSPQMKRFQCATPKVKHKLSSSYHNRLGSWSIWPTNTFHDTMWAKYTDKNTQKKSKTNRIVSAIRRSKTPNNKTSTTPTSMRMTPTNTPRRIKRLSGIPLFLEFKLRRNK